MVPLSAVSRSRTTLSIGFRPGSLQTGLRVRGGGSVIGGFFAANRSRLTPSPCASRCVRDRPRQGAWQCLLSTPNCRTAKPPRQTACLPAQHHPIWICCISRLSASRKSAALPKVGAALLICLSSSEPSGLARDGTRILSKDLLSAASSARNPLERRNSEELASLSTIQQRGLLLLVEVVVQVDDVRLQVFFQAMFSVGSADAGFAPAGVESLHGLEVLAIDVCFAKL